jgi:hypothetical protein
MTASNAQTGNESCLPPMTGFGEQIDTPSSAIEAGTVPDNPGGGWVWRHNLERTRNLCSVGLTPRTITGLIMRFLKDHFSDASLILTPNLRQFVYSEKVAESKIRIVKSVIFDPSGSGQYPALVVKRLNLESMRHSMDDRAQSHSLDHSTEQMQGITQHSRFITGAHRIFCIADVGGEAEDLAQEVFDFLSFMSPAIRDRLPFHDFAVIGMGEEGALNDTAAQVGIAVDLKYTYEYAWALQALAPRLKAFTIGASPQGVQ